MCAVLSRCLTLCDPMDCSPPGSSVHGGSPGKNTGVGCHALSRGSSQPRSWTQVSHIAGGFFTIWATRKTQEYWRELPFSSPGDLPNPGIQQGSPALQEDSLPAELPGKPKSLMLYQLSYPGSYINIIHWKFNHVLKIFFKFFSWKILLYNAMLISAVQPCKSVIIMYIILLSLASLPCSHPTLLGHHRAPCKSPCNHIFWFHSFLVSDFLGDFWFLLFPFCPVASIILMANIWALSVCQALFQAPRKHSQVTLLTTPWSMCIVIMLHSRKYRLREVK